ncbi:amino acid ABC transporter permease [Pectinatus haikarae]|uniref:Glutamine transport system permease protein n=1 Tax=Pectinatus haikarae TaxID=349096 RepID=A0ABT9Y615_9FIRM|nr:amino acid ABC transporter permease [Pectinatus haikarae]MDQ0202632.1 glutamine transport system permease protein [Pectinatus haikarae]
MFDWSSAIIVFPRIAEGMKITIYIAVSGIVIGFIIGLVTGYIRTTEYKLLKKIMGFYVWLVRSTPIIVQALYIYFVLPRLLDIPFDRNLAGIICISINAGAYISEIVRGAILSVPVGQWEAGFSLGMNRLQVITHLIFPLAFKNMLPALGNQFIITVKDTSILTVIGVAEMTYQAGQYAATSFNLVESYTILALFYLFLISVLSVILNLLEKKMGVGTK